MVGLREELEAARRQAREAATLAQRVADGARSQDAAAHAVEAMRGELCALRSRLEIAEMAQHRGSSVHAAAGWGWQVEEMPVPLDEFWGHEKH